MKEAAEIRGFSYVQNENVRLFSTLNGGETTAVEFQEMGRVVLGLRSGSSLEADGSSSSCLSIASGHGDEFHHIEGNIFISARSKRNGGDFVHVIFSISNDNHGICATGERQLKERQSK